MDEHHHVVRTKAALADVSDHGGGAFTRVDRVENYALMAAEQQHRLVARLARDAIALVDEIVVVLDLGGRHLNIQAQHGRKDWWFVTADSTRFLVRIREIDAQGLSGLKPKRASEPAPDAIGWTSIARIDERHSKFLAKSIQGVLYGALIGGTLPFMINQTNGGDYAGWTLLAGAGIGGWLGGLWGDRIAREDPIYVSRTLIAPQPVPLAPRPIESADSTEANGTVTRVTRL